MLVGSAPNNQHLDLGQFEDEQGRQLDGADYLQELLESERILQRLLISFRPR